MFDYLAAAEATPVDRFNNTQTGVHFSTASEREKDTVVASTPWLALESIAY